MSSVWAIAGKIALVTGGSAGIGRATAEALARAGAKVIICARGKAGLEDTVSRAADSGLIIEACRTDVGRPEEIAQLFHGVQHTHGRLDILVNAAGILGPLGHLLDISSENWDEVLRVNLTGTFLTCRSAARIMVPQQSGCMINISSGVGRRGRPGWGPYAVSKFGVEGLTQTLGAELAPKGISVLAVNPGPTRTRMRALACPDEDPAVLKTPDAVAEILIRRVIPGARKYAGQSLDLDDLIIENRV
jgi:NAD(P)-dependent dehydrogenase (short-subunit alcohol dehydrogenase family)